MNIGQKYKHLVINLKSELNNCRRKYQVHENSEEKKKPEINKFTLIK